MIMDGYMTAECCKLAKSQGFTAAYQRNTEEQDNIVYLKKRIPATKDTYSKAIDNWYL